MTVAVCVFLAVCDWWRKAIPAWGLWVLAVLSWPDPNLYGAVCGFVLAYAAGRVLRYDGLALGSGDVWASAVVGLHLGAAAPLYLATSLVAALLTRRFLRVRSVAVIPFLVAAVV